MSISKLKLHMNDADVIEFMEATGDLKYEGYDDLDGHCFRHREHEKVSVYVDFDATMIDCLNKLKAMQIAVERWKKINGIR